MELIKIVGAYRVPEHPTVHLIEVEMEAKEPIDFSKFRQPDDSMPESNWQVAYDEKFLEPHPGDEKVRAVFFMHFLNLNQPIDTPWGLRAIPEVEELPDRLGEVAAYEPV